jgi:hypothetical protein
MVYSAKAAQKKTGDYRDPGISFQITLQFGRKAFSMQAFPGQRILNGHFH